MAAGVRYIILSGTCFMPLGLLLLLQLHPYTPAAAGSSSCSNTSVLAKTDVPRGSFLGKESLYVDRNEFPASFKFGAMTWAIKHEAASYEDGKSDGLWDAYSRKEGAVFDGTNPSVGGDHYHRYPEDIELLTDMGMDSYRFSVAWPRMFPNGTGEVNQLAIDHYNSVINKLIDAGIEPFITLYEQDLPETLEGLYGGLLSPLFIDDFVHFANACFSAFGDRVKHWITFDEGNDFLPFAYAATYCPPGRCTLGYPYYNCTGGDSSTEPYIAGHNMLLAHAAAVDLYRKDYQLIQQGEIGMAIWFRWFEPLTTSSADIGAAERATDFTVGWFIEPILYGDYPSSMKSILGERLPSFTEEESARLHGSVDFIGLNAVTTIYATYDNDVSNISAPGYFEDWGAKLTAYKDGVAIGRNDGEYMVPWGLQKVLGYMRTRYNNFPTYVTALGYGLNSTSTNDDVRVEFFAEYFKYLIAGMRDGADVKGVFAWSLIDGFETTLGLQQRFGLYYVDESFVRHPRLSALWFKNMLTSNGTLISKS
ncbi:hypothetical protein KP509_12G089500 [Ceratopteris richardii]|uniref:Uncharacterized protein n=3 Tax=Ceratopteris richardii TaxID=49495 RepID=A0A8T2TUB1_CERRI|nr:hypothetical protein KP509_12G089500 [Ceratopteris richardii]